MKDRRPIIVWYRRDLRLSDHLALTEAVASGRPVIPVFLHDAQSEALGAAPQWRLGLGLEMLAASLEAKGSRLILRRGDALDTLRTLIREAGAGAVYWSRLYDPDGIARDTRIKAALKDDGIEARSFGGHLLFEPWTVATKAGGAYRVFSPMWAAVRGREVESLLPEPARIPAPARWPTSDRLADWALGAAMNRGAGVVRPHVAPGEGAAQSRLETFIGEQIDGYPQQRDLPGVSGCSGLSDYLSLGEISPHRIWHAGLRAREESPDGAEAFLRQLAWRDFAHHLMYHTPRILDQNWKEDWDGFPWRTDPHAPQVEAWRRGRTGVPFVDAAMREMYVTGRMHNRARMIAASFLTKHLLCHWKIGLDWFAQCLTDWDPANNAMGWQWVAGSGPDAAPYFRIFNPVTQLAKFDPDGTYAERWIAEGRAVPTDTALSYFDAVPRRWGLSAGDPYPAPIVDINTARKAALAAYESRQS